MRAERFAQPELGLDPEDWSTLRATAHRMIDDAVDYLRDVRDTPVWRDPEPVRRHFEAPLPREPTPVECVYEEVADHLMPFPMGNIHPRFWSWFMGASNFTGAMGEFLAAIQGSNLGGGRHAAAFMDQQVISWFKEMLGYPASASGTLLSGGSMANLIGLLVARNVKADCDVRRDGVAAVPRRLRYYGTDQLHSCHRRALEALGLGRSALCVVPTDRDLRMDLVALRDLIARDRAAGLKPACIIASAGTVNTGAIDDLVALAVIAKDEDAWLHVDGCIGALLAIAPGNAHRVAGLALADSIAFDPHKWLHAPFEAGCVLVRDAEAHRSAFVVEPEFLEAAPRGLASGEWLYDYGLQTSRGFRALKIWMALREHGIDRFGALIDQNIAQADALKALVAAEPSLELGEPCALSIVLLRHKGADAEPALRRRLNREIMMRLQEEGIASISDTTIRGDHWLRVAIVNHRTRSNDLKDFVASLVRIGADLTKTATLV